MRILNFGRRNRDLANRQVTTVMLALISAVIIALNAWLLYAALT
jgi:hypothetical protein